MRMRTIAIAMVLSTCLTGSASAAYYLSLYRHAVGPASEQVYVSVNQVGVGYSCPKPVACASTMGTLRVTPCPPGLPCTNGAYESTYDLKWGSVGTTLDLNFETTYTFQFHVLSQYGYDTQ